MRAAARGSAEAAQVRVDLGESFQFLSMSLFLNLLFEQDSYSNEYLLFSMYLHVLAKVGFETAENGSLKV